MGQQQQPRELSEFIASWEESRLEVAARRTTMEFMAFASKSISQQSLQNNQNTRN